MFNRKAAGAGVIVFLLIIIALAAIVLYDPAVLSRIGLGKSTNTSAIVYYNPISFSASLQNPSAQIYSGSQFNAVITLTDHSSQPISVSVSPAGCPFITSSDDKLVNLDGGTTTSLLDSFLSAKSQVCTLSFTACFNYTSSYTYFFSFENSSYTGIVPTVSPVESVSPFNISVSDITQVIPASPSPKNETYTLIFSPISTSGYVNNNALRWLSIASTSQIYVASQSPLTPKHTSINITYPSADLYLLTDGALQLPFFLTSQPVEGKSYSSLQNITIEAGYTYCMQSSYIPISVS
ncbi:MAG: hypothetical protein OH316_01320 [Candidatus Parvarchaeota archaeon]|nr:hypothetical protein [Candidatus Parvarchaeota archaeon]